MPHVDVTMIPGRSDEEKRAIALDIQSFLSERLSIDRKFVSVSIEDIPKDEWSTHMDSMKDIKRFV